MFLDLFRPSVAILLSAPSVASLLAYLGKNAAWSLVKSARSFARERIRASVMSSQRYDVTMDLTDTSKKSKTRGVHEKILSNLKPKVNFTALNSLFLQQTAIRNVILKWEESGSANLMVCT